MGSTPREQVEVLYHVAARSNAEEHIFRDERHYVAGITILGQLVAAGALECHEFCSPRSKPAVSRRRFIA